MSASKIENSLGTYSVENKQVSKWKPAKKKTIICEILTR